MWKIVSLAHAKWIVEWYFLCMLAGTILATWWMLLQLSTYEYVIENFYYSRSFNLNVNTTIIGKWTNNIYIILFKYAVEQRYQQRGKCYSAFRDMNILFRCHSTVIYLFWMWILVIVDNANRISVSYFIYMLSSEDVNNLVNVSSRIRIGIYSWNCYYTLPSNLNVNTSISGEWKYNFCIIFCWDAIK